MKLVLGQTTEVAAMVAAMVAIEVVEVEVIDPGEEDSEDINRYGSYPH